MNWETRELTLHPADPSGTEISNVCSSLITLNRLTFDSFALNCTYYWLSTSTFTSVLCVHYDMSMWSQRDPQISNLILKERRFENKSNKYLHKCQEIDFTTLPFSLAHLAVVLQLRTSIASCLFSRLFGVHLPGCSLFFWNGFSIKICWSRRHCQQIKLVVFAVERWLRVFFSACEKNNTDKLHIRYHINSLNTCGSSNAMPIQWH